MRKLLLATLLLLAAGAARADQGTSVVGSRHDFGPTGGGRFKGTSAATTCAYCHALHGGGEGLSSRAETGVSARLSGAGNAPGAGSRACLSCHDGTVSVGELRGSRELVVGGAGGRIEGGRSANLGTDLRTSHPLSVRPDGPRHRRPERGEPVKLAPGDSVQCSSCHDPHRDSADGKFMVEDNRRSELCQRCHRPEAADATHLLTLRPAGALAANLGPAESGCSVCHPSHGAALGSRLLRRGPADADDATCLACHAPGRGARDVGSDRSRPFAHATAVAGLHAADEGPENTRKRLPEASPGAPRHVACVDCHDPHASSARSAVAPLAGGALAGVWGIGIDGQRVDQVRFEFEVCLKCHGDSANLPQARTGGLAGTVRRAAADANLRRLFSPTSPSSHPVAAPGRNADVPSLKPPLTTASQIACSDCHASDSGAGAGGAGPRGPHGSSIPHLLERGYATGDLTTESAAAYALCYKCHDRDRLLGLGAAASLPPGPFAKPDGTNLHALHVVRQAGPCSACHAVHGVSSISGRPDENAHLVDFDLSIVSATPGGQRRYVSRGPGAGSCALTCHGKEHGPTGPVVGDY